MNQSQLSLSQIHLDSTPYSSMNQHTTNTINKSNLLQVTTPKKTIQKTISNFSPFQSTSHKQTNNLNNQNNNNLSTPRSSTTTDQN